MKAIIIGGGIGGLSAALALRRVGVHADVFEQAAELREVGSGLTVWAGAIRALEQLGIAERVLSQSSKTERFEVRTSTGRRLSTAPLFRLEPKLGVPAGVVIHRADLLRELASGLEENHVYCAARCVSIENGTDAVLARFTPAGAGLRIWMSRIRRPDWVSRLGEPAPVFLFSTAGQDKFSGGLRAMFRKEAWTRLRAAKPTSGTSSSTGIRRSPKSSKPPRALGYCGTICWIASR